MQIKKIYLFLVLSAMPGLLTGCTKSCGEKTENATSQTQTPQTSGETMSLQTTPPGDQTSTAGGKIEYLGVDLTPDAQGLSKATAVLKTNKGTLKFKFYTNDAPNTVRRIVQLIQEKFYNGLAFHRVVREPEPFVVQGGDPKSKNKNDPMVGSGGSGQKLKAEFNGRKHVRGVVSMARASDPNSADSQFYIMLGTHSHLDGQYTVFGQVVDYGEVVDGKDVLDRIRQWDDIVEMKIE